MAIEQAGLDYARIRKRRQWSRETIVRMIRRIHRDGGDLSWSGMQNGDHRAVVRAYPWYFRNWGAAIAAAGLDYEKIRKFLVARRAVT